MMFNDSPFLSSVIRHLLTAVGGWLIGKGIISADQAHNAIDALADILPGIIIFMCGQLASWWDKVAKQKQEKALVEENTELKKTLDERP